MLNCIYAISTFLLPEPQFVRRFVSVLLTTLCLYLSWHFLFCLADRAYKKIFTAIFPHFCVLFSLFFFSIFFLIFLKHFSRCLVCHCCCVVFVCVFIYECVCVCVSAYKTYVDAYFFNWYVPIRLPWILLYEKKCLFSWKEAPVKVDYGPQLHLHSHSLSLSQSVSSMARHYLIFNMLCLVKWINYAY